jgi:branched-chain amino acid transport system substrate-binding protein
MTKILFRIVFAATTIFMLMSLPCYAQPKPIKIGVSDILSGPTGILGILGRQAMQCAQEVIREEGGVIEGRNFEIAWMDNEANVENTMRQIRRFVESDGTKFIVMGGGTHLAKAVQNEASKIKAFIVEHNAMGTFLRGKTAQRNMWFCGYPDNVVVRAVATRVVEEGHTGLRWTGFNPDYGFGHDCWELFKKHIKELDPTATIGAGVFHPFREANMVPYIEKAIQDKPGGIFCVSYASDTYNFLEQATPRKLFQNVIFASFDMMNTLKIGGGGDILPEKTIAGQNEYWEVNKDYPSRKRYIDKYFKMFGEAPIYTNCSAFNAPYLIASAIRKAGTADDIDKVIQAAEDLTFEGAHGKELLRAGDRQVQYPYTPTYILKRAPGEPKPTWLKVPKGGWKVEKPKGVPGWYPANEYGSPFAK